MQITDELRLQRVINRFAPHAARSPAAARLVAGALQQLESLRRRPDLYAVRRAIVRTQPQPTTQRRNTMDAAEAVKAIDTEIDVLARERILRAERERAAARRRSIESLAAQVEGAKANLAHAEGQGAADAQTKFTQTVTAWAERNPGRHFMLGYTDELTLPIVSYVRFCQSIVQQRRQVAELTKRLEAEQQKAE